MAPRYNGTTGFLISGTVMALLSLTPPTISAQRRTAPLTSATPDTDNVKIVTTAEIRKIDEKKETFEVKLTFDNGPASASNAPQQSRVSTGYPGGMGRRGGGGMGRRSPSNNSNRTQTTTLDVKVYASESTMLKDGDTSIGFGSLKNGQRVTITGVHHGTGNDIDAQEISRTTSGGN